MTLKTSYKGSKLKTKMITFGLAAALTGVASIAGATYSIPAARSVVWTGNAGVKGDIPLRSTIYKTLSPSGGDDTAAIQGAITACPSGQVVKLNAGTYTVKSAIKMKSGVTLRGAGMGSTILKGASGMSGSMLIGFQGGGGYGTTVNLYSGYSKGSTTITTSSAHGFVVGDLILIDQLNNPNGDPKVSSAGTNGTCTWCGRGSGTRSLGQISKVVAVPSSTTFTVEIPLYWNYASNLTPQATKLTSIISNAGIEDITADNSASGTSAQGGSGGTFALNGTSNCWMLRVEGIGCYENMVRISRGYRDTIRGCKFHEGIPALPATGTQYGTSRSYGIWLNPASAELVENNQVYHLVAPVMLNGPASGNVFGYNYFTNQYYSPSATWQCDAFRAHGAHPVMNLFEGNWLVGRNNLDNTWGTNSNNTFFRNRDTQDPARPSAAWNFALYNYASYYNIIGNVIGTTGFETGYQSTSTKSIYGIQSVTGTLQHANWDSVTNGVVWNGSDDRTLPASLYLTGKPSWWGSTVPWPAIGPDVTPMYPAPKGAGNGTPWGMAGSGTSNGGTSTTVALNSPTTLTVK